MYKKLNIESGSHIVKFAVLHVIITVTEAEGCLVPPSKKIRDRKYGLKKETIFFLPCCVVIITLIPAN